jgi:hypothetical protein
MYDSGRESPFSLPDILRVVNDRGPKLTKFTIIEYCARLTDEGKLRLIKVGNRYYVSNVSTEIPKNSVIIGRRESAQYKYRRIKAMGERVREPRPEYKSGIGIDIDRFSDKTGEVDKW